MLRNSVPIINAETVVQQAKKQDNIKITVQTVKSIMKDELGLAYRMTKKIPVQANEKRCLVLRQQYALVMLPLLEKGTRILNIDESWLNDTNFTRKMWCPPQSPATVQTKPISYRIALIAALDTEGCIYYSLTQSNTD